MINESENSENECTYPHVAFFYLHQAICLPCVIGVALYNRFMRIN